MDATMFCQSCAMPLSQGDEVLGTNADGTKNPEYCTYCYQNGAYTADVTMEQMIDFCVGPMVEHNAGMAPEKARAIMDEFFPTLKRWRAQSRVS